MPQTPQRKSHCFTWLMLAFAILLLIGVFLLIAGLAGESAARYYA